MVVGFNGMMEKWWSLYVLAAILYCPNLSSYDFFWGYLENNGDEIFLNFECIFARFKFIKNTMHK